MDFSNWVNVVIVGVPALLAVAGLAYAVYTKVKSKQYAEAAKNTVALVGEVVKAVDTIKKGTEGTPARKTVGDALKNMGNTLDNLGLKVQMDQVVSGLGLDSKS